MWSLLRRQRLKCSQTASSAMSQSVIKLDVDEKWLPCLGARELHYVLTVRNYGDFGDY